MDLRLNMDEYLPLREVVFKTLRNAIVHGEFEPGFLVFGHLLINSFHLLYECFLPPSRDKYHHS